MQGRMNSMQKSMLHWNDMHPYSAVHVVQLPGTLEATRLQACIDRTVAKHGLTSLRLNGDHSTFEFESGAASSQLRTVGGAEDPRCALVAEIERQLNLPFEHTRPFSPFRFLVAPANGSFFLGLVYFHALADAESVLRLLKEIVSCYFEANANGSADGFDFYPESRTRLRRRSMVVARKFLSLPVQTLNLRHSHRAPCRDSNNLANGFSFFSLEGEELRWLFTAAKSWSITVNDLLMALLMKSLSPLLAGRAQASKRRKISLGCVVNLRKDLGIDRRVFGVFLGSFVVSHEVPAGISLRKLGADVANQTAPIKRHKLYLASTMEMGFARFMFKLFSPERQKRFYAKHYPLLAGITNMNLNTVWDETDRNVPLDYFRGVSTGPVTPLVLSVTTIGDRMNMGMSYRIGAFSKADIGDLECGFRQQLEETKKAA